MFRQSSFSKFIILSGILIVSTSPVFAATINCDPDSMTEQLTNLLDRILAFFSWLWIPFAILAGKLMGNGFVYGEFFNLDKVLYFLWNLSRTFANFLVVVLIIGELIKQFTDGEVDKPKMMKYILKMGGGILLANMSWFLIGATIDISTILTTTIGALPSTYISQDSKAQETIKIAINNAKNQSKQTIHLDVKQCDGKPTVTFTNKDNITEQKSTEEIMDMILPKENSISGPLMYLGIGVLRLQDFLNTTNIPDDNLTNKLFVISTRVGITLLFIVALVVLVIINIFRIVAVWFFVSFAPLLILLNFADKDKSYQTGLLEKFSIPNIIKAIFAPVIAVGLMSIGLIVIVIMQGFLQFNSNQIKRNDVSIDSSGLGSSVEVDGIFQTTIAGDLFGQDTGNLIKNTFSNILLIIFTLFILYGIIKALVGFLKNGIGGEFINNAVDLGTKALGAVPMIPLPGGGTSIGGISNTLRKQKNEIMNKFGSNNSQNNAVDNAINKMFNIPQNIDPSIYRKLEKYTNELSRQNSTINNEDMNKFFELYKPVKEFYGDDDQKRMNNSLSSMSGINKYFPTLLQKIIGSQGNFKKNYPNLNLTPRKEGETTIEQYIKDNYNNKNITFFKDLYNKLGGDATKLNADGSNFRNQSFRREGGSEITSTTP